MFTYLGGKERSVPELGALAAGVGLVIAAIVTTRDRVLIELSPR